MNQSTIDIIKATAPLVAEHATEITTLFYKTMFANSPEAATFFNVANQSAGRQPQALANAVVAYALNIDNLGALGAAVELIAAKHCGLQVLPQHYSIVHDNLLIAVAEVLKPAVTPEIGAAWSEAVNFLAKILIDAEEKRYADAEARRGGWRGWKNFVVSEVVETTSNVKTFRFVPEEGCVEAFDFTPGQYLSIRVDVNKDNTYTSPRHYTITSKPGDAFLQISTKRIENGTVSCFMHDTLAVGDVVHLSPPFGPFTLAEESTRPAVLISAGIGRTPMKAFLDALVSAGKAPTTVHVDKSEAAVPFFAHFEETNPGKNTYFYSNDGANRPVVADIVKSVVESNGTDNDFYLCGPPSFMMGIAHALVASGVAMDNVKWEAFSPQMACPM
jgi:nitric oxide dioxygenase